MMSHPHHESSQELLSSSTTMFDEGHQTSAVGRAFQWPNIANGAVGELQQPLHLLPAPIL
jgi:hypothetical protein